MCAERARQGSPQSDDVDNLALAERPAEAADDSEEEAEQQVARDMWGDEALEM